MSRSTSYKGTSPIQLLKVLFFLLFFVIIFIPISFILSRKDPIVKMQDFYSETKDFDVLFFGSSHPQYAIQPMELWHEYGLTSYNLAVPSERLNSTYYNIKLALQYTRPKLIVVDLFTIDRVNKDIGPRENPHYTLDLYPATPLKFMAIKEIVKNNNPLLDNEIEYLLNFPLYHNRYDELTTNDLFPGKNYLKGAETSMKTTIINEYPSYEKIDNKIATPPQEYLNFSAAEDIISLCQEQKINLLFTYLPNISNEKQIQAINAAENFIKQYDVPLLNYLKSPINNLETDFMDNNNNNSHLNIVGAKRLSAHLGSYIQKNYDLPDHRLDPTYQHWNTDYNNYQEYLLTLAKESNAL